MADVPAARDLQGKTAVVTGASSGIGRAIALEFASAGANVIVHARSNATGAKQVADEILSLGCESRVALSDLAEKSNRKAFVQDAWDWRGGIDVWVNNAGADVLTGDAGNWTFDEKLQQLWKVDVAATIDLSRLTIIVAMLNPKLCVANSSGLQFLLHDTLELPCCPLRIIPI